MLRETMKVSVTGGNSMIGSKVCDLLYEKGYKVDPILHSECDILRQDNIYERFASFLPDYIVCLATYSGNVNFNQEFCADTFYNTSIINLNTLKACQRLNKLTGKPTKVVSVLSSCAISDQGNNVLKEEDLHKGPPHDSISSHGYAKRILDIYSRFLRKQHNLNCVTCILQNCMGPHDSTDLNKTKVVMSLIKKYYDAKKLNKQEVINWGDGSPLRELVYVDDAAEAIIQIMEKYNESSPINITSDQEISIKELAEKISNMVGYTGQTIWDTTKGNGQLRKKLDSTKMKKYINMTFTELDKSLQETINWYINEETRRNST